MLGLTQYRKAQFTLAARTLSSLGDTILNSDIALFFEAESLFQARAYRKAMTRYRRVIRSYKDSPWRLRARIRIAMPSWHLVVLVAQQIYRKAIKDTPTIRVLSL